MLATSGAFATAVAGTEYYGAWRIQITLPGGVYPDVTLAVESLTLDAQTVSDMPDGTRLQVGYPSLAAEFTLSGLVDTTDESKTAAWLFGRYSTSSPLYRLDALYSVVTVDLGLYTASAGGTPEFVRKFTGVVDDYTVGDDGSVTFTCVDRMRAALRSVPTLSAVLSAPPYSAGLTSEFAVDYLLRAATAGAISSWPTQRAQCVLAAGLRSSVWPERGSLNTNTNADPPAFAPGLFGSALVGGGGGQVYDYALAAPIQPTDSKVFVEFWATQSNHPSIFIADTLPAPTDVAFQVEMTPAGGVLAKVVSTAGQDTWTVTKTVDSSVHYVGVLFSWVAGSGNWSATLYYDATSTTSGTRTVAGTRNSSAQCVTARLSALGPGSGVGGTIEALQVTTETAPAVNNSFTPAAILDPSLNALNVVPEIAAGDPFQTIQQIADAELAVAGGDEAGVFRFYNRNTIKGAAAVRTITSFASLVGIGGVETGAAGVVNHATAEYTGWNFATARTTAWAIGKARKVPAGGTLRLRANTDGLFANIDTTMSNLGAGSGDVANSHYRASINKAGTAEHPGGLTFTVTQTGSTQLSIVIANPSGQDAWLVSPANYVDIPVGTPLLRIAALAVTPADTLTADFQYPNPASTSRFGDQAHQVSGNPWIQDDTTAQTLVYDVVQDMYLPKPNLTGVEIVPDPRIQLIDVVQLQDTDRTFVDEYARIFGWHIEWAAGEQDSTYAMTLDARTVALPGGWIGGVAGRSEGGISTWGY